MEVKWRRELARDFIALGGIPFLVLTIARVSVMQSYYPMQFIVSSAIFFVLRRIFRCALRAGVGLILIVFTSLYYNHPLFTIFASLVYIGIVTSLFYLKREKTEILKGILLGALSAAIGYFIVRAMFK